MPEILAELSAVYPRKSLVDFPNPGKMWAFAQKHVAAHREKEFKDCWTQMLRAKDRWVDEHWFLREFLWCVYVSGFSAKTISKKYDALLRAHLIEDEHGNYIRITEDNWFLPQVWRNPTPGVEVPPHEKKVKDVHDGYVEVYKIFKNVRKAQAVQHVRMEINGKGWFRFHETYLSDRDPALLEELPGIGPALSCHLSRNLGNVDVCKPDVHLKRIAARFGFDSVRSLCKGLSDDPVGKTDLILWLASVDNGTT